MKDHLDIAQAIAKFVEFLTQVSVKDGTLNWNWKLDFQGKGHCMNMCCNWHTGKEFLQLALEKARKLGIPPWVTEEEMNTPSSRRQIKVSHGEIYLLGSACRSLLDAEGYPHIEIHHRLDFNSYSGRLENPRIEINAHYDIQESMPASDIAFLNILVKELQLTSPVPVVVIITAR